MSHLTILKEGHNSSGESCTGTQIQTHTHIRKQEKEGRGSGSQWGLFSAGFCSFCAVSGSKMVKLLLTVLFTLAPIILLHSWRLYSLKKKRQRKD